MERSLWLTQSRGAKRTGKWKNGSADLVDAMKYREMFGETDVPCVLGNRSKAEFVATLVQSCTTRTRIQCIHLSLSGEIWNECEEKMNDGKHYEC